MFTPADMERMPKELEKLYMDLERRIMEDVVRRIQINGEVTRAADWQLYRMHELGESKKAIKSAVQDALAMTDKEIDKIYDEVIATGYTRDETLYKAAGEDFIPYAQNEALQQMVEVIKRQTREELTNITQTMGFVRQNAGALVFNDLTAFYRQTMDAAMLDISSGAFDYDTVLKRTIDTMVNSGIRTIDYESGWKNRIEVAARRAVMTGVTQVTGKINEQNAELLDTEYFEVSWHADARPTHQEWQGRVYSKKELETVCGLGTGDGLGGWNCRHTYYPFIPGVSTRAYTDKQLDAMNAKENTPREWEGKFYTSYEASQKQRKMETQMRAWKRKIELLEVGGASEDTIVAAKCRYRKIMDEYVRFSKDMGLPQQKARLYTGKNRTGMRKGTNKIRITEAEKITRSRAYAVEGKMLDSREYVNKFNNMTGDVTLRREYHQAAKEMLKHRSGQNGEDLYIYNSKTKRWYKSTAGKEAGKPEYTEEIKAAIASANPGELIAFHNHPAGMPPSASDINSALGNGYAKGYAFCHDGKIYEYTASDRYIDESIYNLYLAKYAKMGYNEFEAQLATMNYLSDVYGFSFKEVK